MANDDWVEVAELKSTKEEAYSCAPTFCKDRVKGSHNNIRKHRCHGALPWF